MSVSDDVDAAVWQLTVSEIAGSVARRELSPVEIAQAVLGRIDRLDPYVRAFSHLERDAVLAHAAILSDEAAAGTLRGPLHGVPFGVKEQFKVEGAPTLDDPGDPQPPIAEYDATVVTRLRAAGALLIGKLFMVGGSGTPPTRNPWNLEATPGGSSAGSGAAVGARLVPFALAEQTGGSALRPAAYCGVAALKPTYGRVSRRGLLPLVYSFDHSSIIGTTVEDLSRVFDVIAGCDELDPSSMHAPVIDTRTSAGPPRIGVLRSYTEDWEPDMQAAVESAAEELAAAGAQVVGYTLPEEFEIVFALNTLIASCERAVIRAGVDEERIEKGLPAHAGPAVGRQRRFHRLAPDVVDLIPATYYLKAQRARRWLAQLVDRSMAEFDAVVTATAPSSAPLVTATSGDPTLLAPWSTLGHPTVNIPAGLDAQGMPLGLQLIGPRMTDERVMAASAWCEGVVGRLPVPPMDWSAMGRSGSEAR